jgi:hypothetical protein
MIYDIWHDMMWYDMIYIIWYDIWYNVIYDMIYMIWYDIWYIIYLTAIFLHPVAVVQYTFTHKQYTEQHNRHKQYIEQHISLIRKSADRVPSLRGIHWHLSYNWGKSTGKPGAINSSVKASGHFELSKPHKGEQYRRNFHISYFL